MKKKFKIIFGLTLAAISFASVGLLASCDINTNTSSAATIEKVDTTDEDVVAETDTTTETTYDMYTKVVEEDSYEGSYYEFLTEVLGEDYSISKLMNKSLLNVVSISATWTVSSKSTNPWQRSSSSTEESAAGSGVIYDIDKESGDAYIITCYHVVYNSNTSTNNGISTNISCYLYGQEYDDYKMEATYVGGSISNDIAVLKISNSSILKSSLASAVSIGSSDTNYIGEDVYAVGNNYAEGLSANAGNISLLSNDCEYTIGTTTVDIRCIRIDCAINGGNSGGALFNEYGELSGIVNCKMESEEVDNMAYAIPVSLVEGLVKKIINNYENNIQTLTKAYLGITLEKKNAYVYYNTSVGAYLTSGDITVYSIESNSSAYGVLKTGDIIKTATLNGETITINNTYDLSDFMYNASLGDILTLIIERDNTTYKVEITLNNTITIQ